MGSAILGAEGMSSYEVNIRPGNIARHTPRSAATQGREAAVIDIAQDLLLRELQDNGTLALVAIKGGTAIRKLYAGNEGRFSLDLDFAVAEVGQNRDEVALAFLADLDEDEAAIAQSSPKDRALALRMLSELPGGRLDGIGLY